ncbi:hypothetical protein [Halodurantibacterium flavum]|uniref:Four helix bundle protein n=1 Tax=Halodurantibacterium flavum TaxID=1382802 RepID=A0ABW4S7E7_9RHOB
MIHDSPIEALLQALDQSVFSMEAHRRRGATLPVPGMLAARRRAAATLRAALRYGAKSEFSLHSRPCQKSEVALIEGERNILKLYERALAATHSDAPEFRLIDEQRISLRNMLAEMPNEALQIPRAPHRGAQGAHKLIG